MISNYQEERQKFLNEIVNQRKYQGHKFSEEEKQANDLFLRKVRTEFIFEEGFYSNLAMNYKEEIQSHTFFKDLEAMPKGSLLHHHMVDCIDRGWLKKIIIGNTNVYQRDFSKTLKTDYPTRLVYTTIKTPADILFQEILSQWEQKNPGKTVDQYFLENLTMLPDELSKANNNQDCWKIFMPKYFFALPLIRYKEYYRQHLLNTFRQCIKDKVYRLESRLTPGRLVDEQMKAIEIEEEMDLYNECLSEIRESGQNFSFGIIVEIIRSETRGKMVETLKKAQEIKKNHPDLIIGIDLDGDEDRFPKFEELSSIMITAKQEQLEFGVDIPWILHCGESLKATNQNLIDGCLLGAKRFGHGINLYKHSYLLDYVKEKDICIEINPISNQTLKNVRDLRMHPAVCYLNYGINICISNDDPTLYNTTGVNYDFFVATVCCEFDLFDLKIIALNSIKCSEANEKQKKIDQDVFLKEWSVFITYFINKYTQDL